MANKSVGLIGRVKAAISTLFNGWTPSAYGYYGTGFDWQKNWSHSTSYLGNGFVYAAVREYLKKARVAPPIISRVRDEKSHIKYKEFIKYPNNQQLRLKALEFQAKAMDELDSHPLIELFKKPNKYQTRSEFIESVLGYIKCDVGAFIIKETPGDDSISAGQPVALHVIPNPSQTVQIIYSGNFRDPIKGYKVTIDGDQFTLLPEEVCYIKDWNPLNNYDGVSASWVARKEVETDDLNASAQARTFKHGGSATLISDAAQDVDLKMSPEQMELLTRKIDEKLQGRFGQLTATNGDVKATKIGESPVDMQLLDGRKFNRGAIAAIFGVDGILIGDKEGSKYDNAEQAYKGLVTNAVIPDLLHVQERLSDWLLPLYKGQQLDLSFDTTVYPELQPDLLLQKQVYGAPLLYENEKRRLYNFDDAPILNNIMLVPTGLDTIENIITSTQNVTAEIDNALKSFGDGDYK